ncbi:MAG: RMD1 family protein [Sulfurovum sp.]|nr:RMD1 family protein [Sulfurovum sp.]MDD3602383.1 RMD1 family protein [Sulfurovum sp.]
MKMIKSYKFTKDFDFKEVTQNAIKTFRAKATKDAIIIEKESKYAFVFKYGIAVFWDFSDEEFLLKKISGSSFSSKNCEEFNFELSQAQKIKIETDTVYLDSLNELTMLSVSFAIAQSIKLGEFEDAMLETLQQTEHIPQELARSGRVLLSRKEIARQRGRLFLAKSNIYLHFELLDTPEFFWEYPELEIYYQTARKYLELQPRIEILHRKLSVLQEILTILADEQNHKHSSQLEWIIIILIAFEIIIFIFNDLLKT